MLKMAIAITNTNIFFSYTQLITNEKVALPSVSGQPRANLAQHLSIYSKNPSINDVLYLFNY